MKKISDEKRHLIENELHRYEVIFEKHRKSFFAAGEALFNIRSKKLYKLNYQTWDQYIKHKWRVSRPHAYRLINGYTVNRLLSKCNVKPISESQIRPLTKLKDEEILKIWRIVTEQYENPTARQVNLAIFKYSSIPINVIEIKRREANTIIGRAFSFFGYKIAGKYFLSNINPMNLDVNKVEICLTTDQARKLGIIDIDDNVYRNLRNGATSLMNNEQLTKVA